MVVDTSGGLVVVDTSRGLGVVDSTGELTGVVGIMTATSMGEDVVVDVDESLTMGGWTAMTSADWLISGGLLVVVVSTWMESSAAGTSRTFSTLVTAPVSISEPGLISS